MSRRRCVGQPGCVVVVTVQVRDVQEVGPLDAFEQVVGQLVVAGEREPRTEERRHEPGIAQDRDPAGLDQDAGVADRGRTHVRGAASRSGNRRVGELLTRTRHVLGPRRAVPVTQLVAARRVGVPAGRHGRLGGGRLADAGSTAAPVRRRGSRRPARPHGSRHGSPAARSTSSVWRSSGAAPQPAGSSTASAAVSVGRRSFLDGLIVVVVDVGGVGGVDRSASRRRRCLDAPPRRSRLVRARRLLDRGDVGDDLGGVLAGRTRRDSGRPRCSYRPTRSR